MPYDVHRQKGNDLARRLYCVLRARKGLIIATKPVQFNSIQFNNTLIIPQGAVCVGECEWGWENVGVRVGVTVTWRVCVGTSLPPPPATPPPFNFHSIMMGSWGGEEKKSHEKSDHSWLVTLVSDRCGCWKTGTFLSFSC